MKPDITSREDIENLLKHFYDKAFNDELIGFFFTEVAHLDLETHLPIIANFWENIIFANGKYKGNAIQPHHALHQLSPFKDEHFDRWVSLFNQTIDELFEGTNAELAKQRALSIATIMKIKIIHQK
ncbi:MAG: group hemoglobin [Chitinophagaceae bacterium]|nr:group hemoglobin [Chitinophagaceae bacterium]